MRKKILNESGLSLIDALIAISILAFFVAFLPQVFTQTQKMYASASKRTEMDRMKQIMMIAAKNVERVKKNIRFTIESQGKSYDEFLNCFGQKGPHQPVKLPGVQCDQKFSGVGDTWMDLLEAPGPTGQQNLFWQNWSGNGVCAGPDSSCMMKTWAKYYVSCKPQQCYSVHLTLGVTPMEAMLALQNTQGQGGFSSQDFQEQRMQTTFPATLFGSGRSFVNQVCSSSNPFIGRLDPVYGMLYCNPDMPSQTECNSSIHSLGSAACFDTDYTAQDRGARGSVFPGSIDVARGSPTSISVQLSAEAFGSLPATPVPNPADPLGPPLMVNNPFFDPANGDRLHVNCALPIGEKVFSQSPATTVVVVSSTSLSAPSTLTCTFFVTTGTGAMKGNSGQAEIRIFNSSIPGPGGGNSPSTTTPAPTINPGGARDVDSGEV